MRNFQLPLRKVLSALTVVFVALALTACPPSQTPQQKAEALYNKGNQLWDAGKIQEALQAWEDAIKINPSYYDAYFQLGLAYKKIGDSLTKDNKTDLAGQAYNLSIQYYSKAIQLNPSDPSVFNNIANVYFAQGRYDDCIDSYNKALQLKPYDPDYHYNIANAYSKKGMSKQAIEHYEEAIRIDPNYFDAYYNIANLYEKMGDIPNAVRYYQEYANRENRPGEQEWVNKAKQKVQQLRGGIY